MSNDIVAASGVRAVFETGIQNDAFSDVQSTDVIFKTLSSRDALVFANDFPDVTSSSSPPYASPAGLYVGSNRVGVRTPAREGTALDVRGNLACSDGNLVITSSGAADDDYRVTASHSNFVASREEGDVADVYVDARGLVRCTTNVFSDGMIVLNTPPSVARVLSVFVSSATAETASYMSMSLDLSSNLVVNDLDCARAGDVYTVGNTTYEMKEDARVDADQRTLTVVMRNLSGHDTTVDPVLSRAEAASDDQSERFVKMRKMASMTRPLQSETRFASGAFEDAKFAFKCSAANTSVEYHEVQDGLLVLTCRDDRFSSASRLRGRAVEAGHSDGVFLVEEVRLRGAPDLEYDMYLRAVDGRAVESFSEKAYDSFAEAVLQADEDIMPALHACSVAPHPADVELTQVRVTFKPDFRVFEVLLDAFSEPLSRLLNPVDVSGGNPVRALRFASDASATLIPIKAAYKDDEKVYLETYPSGADAFEGSSVQLLPEAEDESADLTCVMTGFPLRIEAAEALDAAHLVLRGEQFTPEPTRRALRRVRYDGSKLRSRGEVYVVISDAEQTRQWVVCHINDEENALVLRRKDGLPLETADLNGEARFVYITPIIVPRPTTLLRASQPAGMVVEGGLCVGRGALDAPPDAYTSIVNTSAPGTEADASDNIKAASLSVAGDVALDGKLRFLRSDVATDDTVEMRMNGKGELVFGRKTAPSCLLGTSSVAFPKDAVFGGQALARRFKTTSDSRLKERVATLAQEGMDDVSLLRDFMRIPVKRYSFCDEDSNSRHTGVIAQELLHVVSDSNSLADDVVSRTQGRIPLRSTVKLCFDEDGSAVTPLSDVLSLYERDVQQYNSHGGVFEVVVCGGGERERAAAGAGGDSVSHISVKTIAPPHASFAVLTAVWFDVHKGVEGRSVRSASLNIVAKICDDLLVVDNAEILYRTVAAVQSLARLAVSGSNNQT